MSTITREFTKEQLIEKLQHRIAVAAKYPDLEEAQLDAAIFKIALASLEAKPIGAFHISDQQVGGTTDYIKDGEWPIDDGVIEVYAAPPAPVCVDEIAGQAGIDPDLADAYMQGVNDANQRKLADIIPSAIPEGLTGQIVYLCAFDNMPRHELANRIWNACRDAIVHTELSVRSDCPWCDGEGYVEIDHGFEMGVEQKECRHCRAAMLQGAEKAESATTMQTAPELDYSPKNAESPTGINQGKSEPVTTAYKFPDGWVAVPVEPTYQMCKAMGLPWESPRFPDLYKAMLAAVKK